MQPLQRDVDGVVVAPAFRPAVGDEVLGAGGEAVRRRVVVTLVAADLRDGEFRGQVRVFAVPLGDAAPARLVRDVHHRRVRPVDAAAPGLLRRHRRVGARHGGVEARTLGQRDREVRGVPVDDVQAEDQRDAQPRLLDGDVLQRVELRRADHREDPAELPGRQRRARVGLVAEQLQLAELLGEGHLLEQALDPVVAFRPGGHGIGGGGWREQAARRDTTGGEEAADPGEQAAPVHSVCRGRTIGLFHGGDPFASETGQSG